MTEKFHIFLQLTRLSNKDNHIKQFIMTELFCVLNMYYVNSQHCKLHWFMSRINRVLLFILWSHAVLGRTFRIIHRVIYAFLGALKMLSQWRRTDQLSIANIAIELCERILTFTRLKLQIFFSKFVILNDFLFHIIKTDFFRKFRFWTSINGFEINRVKNYQSAVWMLPTS